MPAGFRKFANEINNKVPSGSLMPTYDNFKKNYKQKNTNSLSPRQRSKKKDGMGETVDISMKQERQRDMSVIHQAESQQWQNYMYELQNKIKFQREKIKEADQKEEKFRKKQLETEMEMKVMYNVQQRLIIEYQKSMINNVIPKQDRLYLRAIDNDKQLVKKMEKFLQAVLYRKRHFGIFYQKCELCDHINYKICTECQQSYERQDGLIDQNRRIGSSRESRASRFSGSVNSANKGGKQKSQFPKSQKDYKNMDIISEQSNEKEFHNQNKVGNNKLCDHRNARKASNKKKRADVLKQTALSWLNINDYKNIKAEPESSEQSDDMDVKIDIRDLEILKGGISIREAHQLLQKQIEEKKLDKNNKKDLYIPGYGFDRCKFKQLQEFEKIKAKPKKSTPMQILIQQQFLIDQGKTKKAEQAWFNKLEEELDRIETDELLAQKFKESKQTNYQDQKAQELPMILLQESQNKLNENDIEPSQIRRKYDQIMTPGQLKNDSSQVTPITQSYVNRNTSNIDNKLGLKSHWFQNDDYSNDDESFIQIDYDTNLIKNCIKKISTINQKQIETAYKETQRNRKISSIGSMNVTLGQAYFNLNSKNISTTAQQKTMQTTRFSKHQGSFFQSKAIRSPKLVPANVNSTH